MAVTGIAHEFKVEYMDRVIRTLIEHAHPKFKLLGLLNELDEILDR